MAPAGPGGMRGCFWGWGLLSHVLWGPRWPSAPGSSPSSWLCRSLPKPGGLRWENGTSILLEPGWVQQPLFLPLFPLAGCFWMKGKPTNTKLDYFPLPCHLHPRLCIRIFPFSPCHSLIRRIFFPPFCFPGFGQPSSANPEVQLLHFSISRCNILDPKLQEKKGTARNEPHVTPTAEAPRGFW